MQRIVCWRFCAACLLSMILTAPLGAQRNQVDPLSPSQQEKIAEAGIAPDIRIGLYTQFLNEDAEIIGRLVNRRERGHFLAMDTLLQKFSALAEELSSNLDEYGERKADLRKSLKTLNQAVPRWEKLLKSLPDNSTIQISRNSAMESLSDLADQSKKLSADQDTYFKEHKKAKGQDREEPD